MIKCIWLYPIVNFWGPTPYYTAEDSRAKDSTKELNLPTTLRRSFFKMQTLRRMFIKKVVCKFLLI